MAAKRKTGKTRKRRSARGSLFVLWLAVGLVVLGGGAWYFWAQREAAPDKGATEARPPATRPAPAEPETPVEAPDRFEFYDSLPQAEVPIAEDGKSPPAGVSLPPVVVAGTYVVQAGAFPEFADADAVKARLALLGIVAEIQSAEADGRRFHRVRIGPIDDLDQLNRLRARLRQNRIEFMLIPVAE
jgi:cell division protein FtsN